jgi:hypothetical protein
MNGPIDLARLEQTSFDSARPSGNATVAHRLVEEGRFAVTLLDDGDGVIASRTIVVEPTRTQPDLAADDPTSSSAAQAARPPRSVMVDVSDAAQVPIRPAPPDPAGVVIDAGGYVSFSAPLYSARRFVVTKVGQSDDEDAREFESERLRRHDVFALTLIRPGTYLVRNTLTKNEGRIVVTYPGADGVAFGPTDPSVISCGESGFDPQTATISPAQGVIFQAAADCRITVDLLEPDDGPRPAPVSWHRPDRGSSA